MLDNISHDLTWHVDNKNFKADPGNIDVIICSNSSDLLFASEDKQYVHGADLGFRWKGFSSSLKLLTGETS